MTFVTFYFHHYKLVDLYDVSVLKLTNDMLPFLKLWFTIYVVRLLCTKRDHFPNMTVECEFALLYECRGICTSTCNIIVLSYDVALVNTAGYCLMSYRLWFQFCLFDTFLICLI